MDIGKPNAWLCCCCWNSYHEHICQCKFTAAIRVNKNTCAFSQFTMLFRSGDSLGWIVKWHRNEQASVLKSIFVYNNTNRFGNEMNIWFVLFSILLLYLYAALCLWFKNVQCICSVSNLTKSVWKLSSPSETGLIHSYKLSYINCEECGRTRWSAYGTQLVWYIGISTCIECPNTTPCHLK